MNFSLSSSLFFLNQKQNRTVFIEQPVYEEEDCLIKDIKDHLHKFTDSSQIDLSKL